MLTPEEIDKIRSAAGVAPIAQVKSPSLLSRLTLPAKTEEQITTEEDIKKEEKGRSVVLDLGLAGTGRSEFKSSIEMSKIADDFITQAQRETDPVRKQKLLKLANDTLRQGEQISQQGEEKLNVKTGIIARSAKVQEDVVPALKEGNLQRAGLRLAGGVAGLAQDVGGAGMSAVGAGIPQEIKDKGFSVLKTVADKMGLIPTDQEKQQLIMAMNTIQTKWDEFEKANPQMAQDIKDTTNIALTLADIAGYKAAEKITKGGIETIAKQGDEVLEFIGKKADEVGEVITKKSEQKVIDKALEAVTPKANELSVEEYKKLLDKGKIAPKTKTKPASYILDEKEIAIAKKNAHLLQDIDPVKNFDNMVKEVINKDAQVGEFLAKNTKVYVKDDLKAALTKSLSGVSDITIPKSRLAEARKDLINTFMSRIEDTNTGRTFDKLWEFRKNFDDVIDKKLNAFSGSPSLKKELSTELRNGIQDFIADNTTEGVYKGFMKDMSELYKLRDIVGNKATKEKGMSAIKVWKKKHPTAVKLLWGMGTSIGVGTIGGAIID